MRFKCDNCGSSKLKIVVNTDKDNYTIDPKKPNINNIQKILKQNIKYCFWDCHGDCEDETSASMTDNGKVYTDPIDVLEFLSNTIVNSSTPSTSSTSSTSSTKKILSISIDKAVKIGDIEIVKKYIDEKNDLDLYIKDIEGTKDKEYGTAGWTLLILALKEYQYDIAELLIKSGCDVNKPIEYSSSRATPLMITVGNKKRNSRQFEIVDLLMSKGANPYQKDVNGDDVFHYADIWSKKLLKNHILSKLNK